MTQNYLSRHDICIKPAVIIQVYDLQEVIDVINQSYFARLESCVLDKPRVQENCESLCTER